MNGLNADTFLYTDAPIREFGHEDNLCRNCTSILRQDCGQFDKQREKSIGYWVTVDCAGFDDYRNYERCN